MDLSAVALQMAGAVALLLYSTRMVRTGFERAAGPALRRGLLQSGRNVATSVLTGMLAAMLLQSATAVALLVSGFASTGMLSLVGALTIVLGADVGTALVVQLLSLDIEWLVPALLATGGFCFLKLEARATRQIGRVIMGIAFILLSLRMIGQATEPLRDGGELAGLVRYLGNDAYLAALGGLLITFVFHSSVAAILLFAAMCAQGILPLAAALPMVLGANAGGGLVALWLTRGGTRESQCITLANFIFRSVLGLIVLQLSRLIDLVPLLPGREMEQQLVNFHLLYNLLLLFVCVPLVRPTLALAHRLLGSDPRPVLMDESVASALDREALDRPDRALASVVRELLRMSQTVELMMAPVLGLFEKSCPESMSRVRGMDLRVDEAQTRIKLYVAELTSGSLSVGETRRSMELTSVAINLERAGDIISRDLLRRVKEKHGTGGQFSKDGWREISVLHARVLANMQLALNVLVSDDVESAKQLIIEKSRMGKLERETRSRHMRRLMRGTPESIATSDLHLEVVRSLKEINSLYTGIAYAILARYGVLLNSRIAGGGVH